VCRGCLEANGAGWLGWAFLAIVLALGQAGCKRKSDPPPSSNKSFDPRWVVQSTPRSEHVIVFVHGLFGDAVGTWTNKSGKTFFDYLKETDAGRRFDIFAFGYASNMVASGSLDVREASNKLQESLKFTHALDYPSITFVAHSMGGLVVLHLISNPDLAAKVRLVVLYATPQEGAQIAEIADKFSNNPALAEMYRTGAKSNAYLQQLSDDWRGLQKRPTVICGYETKPSFGVMIVSNTGATRFCDSRPAAIDDADHLTIVKPDRPMHPSLVLLANSLDQYVLQAQPEDRHSDIKASFQPYPAFRQQLGIPSQLNMMLEEPDRGPFGFLPVDPASPNEYRNTRFDFPKKGDRLHGYMMRSVSGAAFQLNTSNMPAIQTHFCLQATNVFPPPGGIVYLNCVEGATCKPPDLKGSLVPCGAVPRTGLNLRLDFFHTEAAYAEERGAPDASRPQAGDWFIPRLTALREKRSTPQADCLQRSHADPEIRSMGRGGGGGRLRGENQRAPAMGRRSSVLGLWRPH
jgi:hypothetical protein